jgi:CubicO group peptidase (beta-lactamase class C family)
VSTGVERLPHRVHWPNRRVIVLVAGLLVAAGIAVGIDRLVSGGGSPTSPQRILDSLVSGPDRVAPGATAYVLGPHGTWIGSAGIANVATGARMQPDARLRIQSLSKTWLLVAMLQLAKEGKVSLDETVSSSLPGLLPHHGSQITIRELMSDTSGLIDDNDISSATPRQGQAMLARVKDPKLRAELVATVARIRANPNTYVSPLVWIKLADWQPLVAPPGTQYHHSNIGWNIAGLIAARVAGEPLPVLYRQRLFAPLGLTHTAYDPQGPIAGQHAQGYSIARNGGLTDATGWTQGKGADGAIVTDAAEEAAFLKAILDNKLGIRREFLDFYNSSGRAQACPGNAFNGVGAGDASQAYIYLDRPTGTRIAVLLLNGTRATISGDDPKAAAAARQLYCGT